MSYLIANLRKNNKLLNDMDHNVYFVTKIEHEESKKNEL